MKPTLCEQLGISPDEVQERTVKAVVQELLTCTGYDEDGDPTTLRSPFKRTMQEAIQDQIQKAVDEMATKEMRPKITEMIATATFAKHNRWGESKEDPKLFKEHIHDMAKAWLTEQVDSNGRNSADCRARGQSFNGHSPRLEAMIHDHFKYHLDREIQNAVKEIDASLAEGIKAMVDDALKKAKHGINAGLRR